MSGTNNKRKILLLSSQGGYCHGAATRALKAYLGSDYAIEVAYPVDEVGFGGCHFGEELYNTALRYSLTRSVDWIGSTVGPPLMHLYRDKIEHVVAAHIERHNPDLVLSVIPFINFPATEAARKASLPYLLVTLDSDLHIWLVGMSQLMHHDFTVTIGHDLPTTRGLIEKLPVPDESIKTVGFPLHPGFSVPRCKELLREQWEVPLGCRVVLVMMGGAGGIKAFSYAKAIADIEKLNAHIIVCAGKNEGLVDKLKGIKGHPSNTLQVVGFTDQVDQLMAMADLLVTKPGPGTIHEAMAMHLPMLLDATTKPVSWEIANIELVENRGLGRAICSAEEIPGAVHDFLHCPEKIARVQQAYAKLPPNQFATEILPLVAKLTNHSGQSRPHVGCGRLEDRPIPPTVA